MPSFYKNTHQSDRAVLLLSDTRTTLRNSFFTRRQPSKSFISSPEI